MQWNTQLLSHLLDHGHDPATAVTAPRFTVHPGSDADVLGRPPELRVESRLGPARIDALRASGHDVIVQDAWDAAAAPRSSPPPATPSSAPPTPPGRGDPRCLTRCPAPGRLRPSGGRTTPRDRRPDHYRRHDPRKNGHLTTTGLVGRDLDLQSARQAAALATRNAVAAAIGAMTTKPATSGGTTAAAASDGTAGGVLTAADALQRVRRWVRMTVYVACAKGFTELSAVADGASAALDELTPELTRPARSAIGVRALPAAPRRGRTDRDRVVCTGQRGRPEVRYTRNNRPACIVPTWTRGQATSL